MTENDEIINTKQLFNDAFFYNAYQMQCVVRFSLILLMSISIAIRTLLHTIQSNCYAIFRFSIPKDIATNSQYRCFLLLLLLQYPLLWKLFNFRSYPATNEAEVDVK